MNLPAHKINNRNQFIILRAKKIGILVSSFLVVPITILIKLYQICLSPLLGSTCRFYPSCSNYALESYRKYGLLSGSLLTMKRLFKCHPFHSGGFDEVPLKNVSPKSKELG